MILGRFWCRVIIPWQPAVHASASACGRGMSKLVGITTRGNGSLKEKGAFALSGQSALKFFGPLLLRRSMMPEKTASPSLSEHTAPGCLFSRKALEQSTESTPPATANNMRQEEGQCYLTSVMSRGLLGKFSSTNRA